MSFPLAIPPTYLSAPGEPLAPSQSLSKYAPFDWYRGVLLEGGDGTRREVTELAVGSLGADHMSRLLTELEAQGEVCI